MKGTFKSKAVKVSYDADFSEFVIPGELESRFSYDEQAGTIHFSRKMTQGELELLKAATTDDNQRWAIMSLYRAADWFESVLKPDLISPVKKLRSWAFVFCFLSIGLSTRIRELATFGMRPFYAFTVGVLVNVPLGYFLSTVVFRGYWDAIH